MTRRIVLILIVALFAGSVIVLTGTTAGLQTILGRVPGLSATLEEGTLTRGFILTNVNYEQPGNRIQADRLQLDWQLWSVLLNHLDIHSLHVQGLKVNMSGSNSDSARAEIAIPELPIDITLDELNIEEIEVTGDQLSEPLTVDQLLLSARTEGQRLQIDTLQIRRLDNRLDLNGQVWLDNELSHSLAATWTIQPTGQFPRLGGTATVQGTVQNTEIKIPVTEPLQAELVLSVDDPVNTPVWMVDLFVPSIDLSVYRPQLPAGSFNVLMNATGNLENAQINSTVRLLDSGADPDNDLIINSLEILLSAEVNDLGSDNRSARGVLSWPQISLIKSGQNLQIENGQLEFDYAEHQLQFDSRSGFAAEGVATGSWNIQGTANTDSIRIETLQVELEQGRVTGRLAVNNLQTSPDINTRLNWDGFMLMSASELVTSGTLELTGTQDNYTATLASDFNHEDLPPVTVNLTANGDRTATVLGSLTLETLEGTLTGTGDIAWNDDPRINLELSGEGINPAAYWLEWPGRIDLETKLGAQILNEEPELEIEQLSVRGDLRDHAFLLELPASYKNKTLQIRQGSLNSGASSVRIDGMLSTEQNNLSWVLDAPDMAELYPSLQGRIQASGSVSGTIDSPVLSAVVEADNLGTPWGSLKALNANIGFDEQIDVQLQMQTLISPKVGFDSLNLDVHGTPDQHDYQLKVTQGNYHLNAQGQAVYADQAWSTELEPLEVTTSDPDSGWPPGGLVADRAWIQLRNLDQMRTDYKQIGIEAGLDWNLEDLSFLDHAGLQITDIRGSFDTDISVEGSLGEPHLSGRITLADSEFIVPVLGIRVDQINSDARTSQNGNFVLGGQARSGNGQVSLQADIQAPGATALSASGTIRGENIEIINVPEIRALASPDLHLALVNNRPRVNGTIKIPEAQINLDEFRDTIVLSDDVVLNDAEEHTPGRSRADVDIELQFGDRINLQGQGLRGRVTGKLNVYSNERGELLGNGEVAIVDGKFSAYGQSLQIEQGRLIFARSRLDNPELRITAVRRIDETISAGLRITGYASNPVITLFSTPTMSDDEVLAYIVFGRPLQSLTSGEGTDLIGAATALGLRNTDFLTRRLSSTFGLDRLQITSDAGGGDAALEVGKYLTPKLYISYAMSVFERVVTGNIRYDLNSNWSVEVKSSTDVGVDLYYKIQK